MNQNNLLVKFVPVEFDPFEKGAFSCAVPAIEPQKEIFASVLLGGDDANCSYNESISLRLTGPFNNAAMVLALQQLINRHESLRACFSGDGNDLLIYETLAADIRTEDLSSLNRGQQQEFIKTCCERDAATPFNLLEGPLFRIALFKLSKEDHYLTFMTHHIISDGWSLGTLLQDLSTLYTTYCQGKNPDLPEASKYSQYAVEQHEFSTTKEFRAIEQYWIDQYKEHVPILEVPTDFPRPPVRTYKSRRDDFILDGQVISSIKTLGAKAGCSFVTTFLMAFEVYLHRLTGQTTFVLGMPAAGQSATGNYDLVGHCVNLLPLRCDIDEEKNFSSYLASRKNTVLDAYENQLFTFGSLLKKIPLPRDASRVPLVPVVFNIDINLDKDVRFLNLKHELISNPRAYENFDIFLNVMGSEEALSFEWSYNTQLFTPATIKRMMDGFVHMLKAIIREEGTKIKDLPIADHYQAIDWQKQWNNTKSVYPKTRSLHHIISEQAKQCPGSIALEFGTEKVTYAQLDMISDQLAALLRDNGIEVGDTVAVALDRSEKTIISLLAILKSGAAYVPLDPGYPMERLQFMLQDSNCKILLTSKKYNGSFQTNAKKIIIDDIWSVLSSYATNENVTVSGKDLAYILYTSGSTGKPKGVQIEHHSLINLLLATKKLLSVTKEDRLLSVTTISFDISGLEMYLPLISGAAVIIADDETVRDGHLLLNTIRSAQPTIMQATPSTWRILLEAGWNEDLMIQKICCGGEALSMDLAKRLLTRADSLFNMYGPTETTIWSTVKSVKAEDEIITIGHAIDNTDVFILDANRHAVPQQVVGEIYIGGDGTARGYLNRQELTEEKFIANPFIADGSRLYRTGDLGRYLANGEIQCLGRMDHQVKIRGHRIELEEIEQCLVKLRGIKQAVVIAKEKSPGDQRLVAYLIVDNESSANGPFLNWAEQLKSFLPAFMIPGEIVVMDAFPLTPNGKIDRKLLPAPEFKLAEKEYTAPRNDIEQMIANIWAELLGVRKISVQDNFFELGGHSLIAAQLMTRLEKETGRRLLLTEIFRFSTLGEFAALFSDGLPTDQKNLVTTGLASTVNETVEIHAPATESQMEIWLACIIGGDDANRSYNLSISEWLEGKLERPAMERALQDLINRHESLRSRFSEDGKNICIQNRQHLNLLYEDLTRYTSDEQQLFIDNFSRKNADTPFNLSRGPLYRIALFKLGDEKHYLTFAAHHIICDGWSLGIILQETSMLYSAYVKSEMPQLPEAPLYSQHAAEVQTFLKSEIYKKTEQFWIDMYKDGAPVLNMPTDFPRSQNRTYKSHRDDYPLNTELIAGIKKIGTQAGCSIAISLRAVFELFVYRLTGQDDIVLGLPAAGQLASGNYNLVGHCVNLLPIRSKFIGNPSFIDYLQQRKSSILDDYNYQQVTFGSLLKRLHIARDKSRVPLVPVVFNIEMGIDDGVHFHGIKNTMVFNPREYETFEIFLNIGGTDDAPTLEWSYNTQLFKADSIRRMMNEFEALLKMVVNNPEVELAAIVHGNIADALLQQKKWNHTAANYDRRKPLHQLISEQARNHPGKLAVQCDSAWITYGELDKLSNQLAALLIENGVKVGDTVGLALDRSEITVVSLLAVLKSGGVYVPLDPGYPKDRIEFMLEDSGAKLLLVSKKYKGHFAGDVSEIVVEDIWSTLTPYPGHDVVSEVSGSALAYIIYTSGSTGKPKGVQIEHRNLVNFLCSMQKNLCIRQEDKLAAVTTISFDISGMEIYLPLICGATLMLLKMDIARDAGLLLNALQSDQPTIMQATPATWKMLLEVGWSEDFCINTICCGGEALSLDLADKLLKRSKALYNLYGPTETTIWSTFKKIEPAEQTITIGRPIDNTQVYILDENRKPLQTNGIGEIYIGGDGVARGYLGREQLTAEKFIINPFVTDGSKLYRTGDLGRYLSNGEIQCLGRIDHQVKIRGHRIELEEIEHWFLQRQEIKQVVVAAREDNPGDQRLVAYIVLALLEKDTKEYLSEWKKRIKDSLPSYMIPNDFVLLQSLPLTPNGKIDRKALPKPELRLAREMVKVSAPQSEEEKLVAKIWMELLCLAQVSVDDDFFELGGHSLIAIQMMSRLEKETKIRLPLAVLFDCPTIKQLAEKLEVKQEKAFEWNSLVPIRPSGNRSPLYIVHGAGLNVLIFKSLAENMDDDQPIFGLQAKGLNGEDQPLESIEQMASYYLSEILKHNPSGPYMLAGYSFGGTVAYEMAKQLQAMSKEVKLLALFDTPAYVLPQGNFFGKNSELFSLFLKEQAYFFNLVIRNPKRMVLHQKNMFRMFAHKWFYRLKTKITGKESIFFHKYMIERTNTRAIRKYHISAYNGTIDLFRAKQQTFYLDDPKFMGWKPLALKGVKIHEINTEHNRLFELPYVQELASSLQQCIDHKEYSFKRQVYQPVSASLIAI